MNNFTYKQKLIFPLLIEFTVIIIHRVLIDKSLSLKDIFLEWHYLLALAFGIFVVLYALNIKCSKCNSRQVFRGMALRHLRFPGNECYKCGADINKQ